MNTRSCNILVVDDEHPISEIVSTILRRQGHTVEAAENGKLAFQLFAAKSDFFDIVITDHSMPEKTGLELVRDLRASGYGGRIIVMSGSLTNELTEAYRAHSVDAILQKPFTPASLSTILDNLLEKWK